VIGQLVALKKFDSAMLVAASMRMCPFAPRTKSVAVKPGEAKDLPLIRTDFNLAEDQVFALAMALYAARLGVLEADLGLLKTPRRHQHIEQDFYKHD
jgi:hypothetical protein